MQEPFFLTLDSREKRSQPGEQRTEKRIDIFSISELGREELVTVSVWSELVLSMAEAGRMNQTSFALLLTPKEAQRGVATTACVHTAAQRHRSKWSNVWPPARFL